MKKATKNREGRHFEREKVIAGAYDYRGFGIWFDATKQQWTVNGPAGGDFSTLREAQQHCDRVTKFGVRFKKKKKASE